MFDLDIQQIDAVNAFINSELDEEVYTRMAEGFSEYGYVYLLKQALYSLRRAPRLWQRDISKALEEIGIQRIDTNSRLYMDDETIISVFTDDILFLYYCKGKEHANNLN